MADTYYQYSLTSFVEFLCIHPSAETRNHRGLKQNVEMGPEGKIVSRCKRGDTGEPKLDRE
jgi:hypothetical protein